MDDTWKAIVWRQFGAAIDMLENAMHACPDDLWSDRAQRPEFWYVVFHTLFFLDLYLSDTSEGFTPPAPFTLDEMDPAGVVPERPYTKAELQAYLDHGRAKCRRRIQTMTDEKARERCGFEWLDLSISEVFLYNIRHVQHHAAQLILILRQKTDSAPRWVARTKDA
ncbi:MAG: DinB family protein [Acidobacteriota bacterium]